MADKKYLIIDTEILPEVYEKVLEVKELLRTGRAKGITEAVQMIGISRSTFYKYKDFIFSSSESSISPLSGLLEDRLSVLRSGLAEQVPETCFLCSTDSSWPLPSAYD